jgi:hypothetical protein
MEHADACRGYGPWWKRFAWLVLIWLLGVGALGLVAFGLKLVMRFAGLTS